MSNFSEFHDHQTGLNLKNRELNLCAVFVLWFSGGHLSFHLTALLLWRRRQQWPTISCLRSSPSLSPDLREDEWWGNIQAAAVTRVWPWAWEWARIWSLRLSPLSYQQSVWKALKSTGDCFTCVSVMKKLAKLYSEIWEGQLPNSGEGKRLVQVFVFCLRDLLDCSCHYIRDSSLDSSLSTMSIICLHLMFKQPQAFLLASYLCLEKVETSRGSIDSTVSIHREWVSIHHCHWIDTPVASLIHFRDSNGRRTSTLHRYLSTGGIT